MGIIIDILILLLFLRFILKNYKKPLLRCGIETVCFVLSAGLSVPICILLSNLCYQLIFRNALVKPIADILDSASRLEGSASFYSLIMNQMPTVVQNASDSYQTNTPAIIEQVDKLVMSGASTAGVDIIDIIAKPVIEGVFRATFCVVLFVGLHYLLTSLGAMVENALYTPDRASQNTVLCAVLGCFKCLVVTTIIITFLQLILPALPVLPLFNAQTLGESFLFKLFYHQNILMLFLGDGIYAMSF